MSEHRLCPVTGTYVVVSAARAGATKHLVMEGALPELSSACPFCPEHAAAAEPVLASDPPGDAWHVRVLPNKFPAFDPNATGTPHGEPARGRHEVVVECREHEGDLITFDDAHLLRLFALVQERVRSMESDPEIEHVSVFRNRGRRAGASQPHPHMQIVGSRIPGREQTARLETALRAFTRTGEDVISSLLRSERAARTRVLADAEGMVSLAAYAPQRTGEVWVVPEARKGSFTAFDRTELAAFARAIRALARAACAAIGRADYNVILRTLPPAYALHPASYVYAEILPRGGGLAGFELTTGAGLVSILPEDLAERVRDQYTRL